MNSVLQKMSRTPSFVLIVMSGALLGLNAPGNHTQWVGFFSLFPFLVVLDRIHRNGGLSRGKRLGYFLLVCWTVGAIAAPLGVPWMTHSAEVFGHLPKIAALSITSFAYGIEVGYLLFVCFVAPLFFIRPHGQWDILFRLSFYLLIETFLPQFFRWSFAGMTLAEETLISQSADIIGSPRLGLFSMGFAFLLLLAWRRWVEKRQVSAAFLKPMVIGYLSITLVAVLYGVWRTDNISANQQTGAKLQVVAIQPNFSLQHLASNKELAYSGRQRNLSALLDESLEGLKKLGRDGDAPVLLVWPESAFPAPYFKREKIRARVERFARDYQVYIMLASIDWDDTVDGRRYNGISLLIGPDGQVVGRYNKIFLIPFGEYIPGADLFPAYANLLRENIVNLSEFEAGTEYTVFNMSEGLPLSASICFDVFSDEVIPQMSRNGAQLVINLANLAWFGKTTASKHMEMSLRWLAIENRVPVFEVSNNGETFLVDELGNRAGDSLTLYEQGHVLQTIRLQSQFSLYRDYTTVINSFFLVILLVVAAISQSKARLFSKRVAEG